VRGSWVEWPQRWLGERRSSADLASICAQNLRQYALIKALLRNRPRKRMLRQPLAEPVQLGFVAVGILQRQPHCLCVSRNGRRGSKSVCKTGRLSRGGSLLTRSSYWVSSPLIVKIPQFLAW
jgi:hypothetical protein